MRLMKLGTVALLASVAGMTAPARADYILSPVLSGTTATSVNVAPGGTFAVDFVLSYSTAPTQTVTPPHSHNSAIFNPTFSAPNLTLVTYQWTNTYTNATGPGQPDDSTPNVVDQGDGRPVTPESIVASTFPGAAIDIEMSNATFGNPTTGNIATLTFSVPSPWTGPSSVTISSNPDTFASGSTTIPTAAGPNFTVNIIPEPASAGTLSLLATGLLARRRRARQNQA